MKAWRGGKLTRRMTHQRVVPAMTNRSLERLVQDPSATDGVEMLQLGLELRHILCAPLLHSRHIHAAELRHVKQRPCALGRRRRSWKSQAALQVDAQIRQRPVERELLRSVLERRPFEEQAHGEISRQRHRKVSCRHAIGTFFDLPDHPGPPAQREKRRAQILGPLIVRNTELGKRVFNRGQFTAAGGAIFFHQLRERSRPRSAGRSQRRVVELEKAGVDASASLRHRPVSETLIEVTRDEPDQRRMNPRVGVDVVELIDHIPMPNEQRRIDGSRLAGTTNGVEAGVPQLTDCGPFLSGRPIGSTESRQHRARVRRQIRAEPRERGGFFQDP